MPCETSHPQGPCDLAASKRFELLLNRLLEQPTNRNPHEDPLSRFFFDIFQTAAFEVFSAIRNSSWGGIMLVVGAALVLLGVGVAVTLTKRGQKADEVVANKIVMRYVETGEVRDQLRRR